MGKITRKTRKIRRLLKIDILESVPLFTAITSVGGPGPGGSNSVNPKGTRSGWRTFLSIFFFFCQKMYGEIGEPCFCPWLVSVAGSKRTNEWNSIISLLGCHVSAAVARQVFSFITYESGRPSSRLDRGIKQDFRQATVTEYTADPAPSRSIGHRRHRGKYLYSSTDPFNEA